MAVTINWNGDITGKTPILDLFYKVSDRVFSVDELVGGKATLSAGDVLECYPSKIEEGLIVLETDSDECAIIANTGTYTIGEQQVEITESGTYFLYVGEIGLYVSSINLPNAEEITKPLATIEYNGQVIASLNAGETATLSCEGKKMVSDVVVKVNEVESKIPDGYIKPEGSLPITENGTYPVIDKEEVVVNVPIPDGYIKPEGTLELVFNNIEAEFPIDCSKYAKVTVNTAEPLKITDPTVLDNITDSPYGVGGNVFLYEGATTDSYEKGVLYYLEDTDK